MASRKPSDSWWAQVMYPSYHNRKDCVPVKDIVASVGPKPHRKRTPFCPKHIKDFEQHQLYRVETAIDSVDKRKHPYHVFIGKIRGKSLDCRLWLSMYIIWRPQKFCNFMPDLYAADEFIVTSKVSPSMHITFLCLLLA
jgi:hypothetical protein